MARRRYQRGSVTLRGTREPVWVGRWREDVVDSNGRVRRIRKNEVLGSKKAIPTKKLALRELEARLAPINDPSYRARRTETFAQFVTFWKANVLPNHKPSTQYSINSQLKNHLVPYFGNLVLRDIQWQTIQEFIRLCKKSPKTCHNLVLTLQMVWKAAKSGGYVQHDPFSGLVFPHSSPTLPFFYTAEEAKSIILAAEGQFKTLYWVAAETGVRPGELCALRVEDLDLKRFLIHVKQSVWRDTFTTPKTRNALRSIAISEGLAQHLREFLLTWRPNTYGLIFVSTSGGPLHPSSVRRDNLGPICETLGIAAKGLKAFRHCSATMMDQAGVPMKVRQERLGHAPGTKVTMVHYTHSVSADARLAASAVGGMLVN
jgi:integrase